MSDMSHYQNLAVLLFRVIGVIGVLLGAGAFLFVLITLQPLGRPGWIESCLYYTIAGIVTYALAGRMGRFAGRGL
jgi:hypothetical protein